ncbi:MAG: hypothetical protein P4L28_05340 [Paludibacteraceae bacterium]|nr:hypothetical protein [Paludibacteraceae bacterium]
MKNRIIKLSLVVFLLSQVNFIYAQDSKGSLNVTADIVNRFIWRGQNVGGSSVHIQPTLSYSNSGFELGTWGTYGVNNDYAEVDEYVKYSVKGFTLTFTNYYDPITPTGDSTSSNTRFYNFNGKTTASVGELALAYKGPASFPISLSAATYLYGNDHSYGYDAKKDADTKNYYSTYLELGYTAKLAGQNLDLFAGFTPSSGYYGNGAGFVNIGAKGYRTIKITDSFSLPVSASLITNPQKETIYLVFGVTL